MPHEDGGELNEGEAGAGQFVVAGGEATVPLELGDQAFDDIALAIGVPVNHVQPGFTSELRDDRDDATAPQKVADEMAV
mgnify:CR=1 FL=1